MNEGSRGEYQLMPSSSETKIARRATTAMLVPYEAIATKSV